MAAPEVTFSEKGVPGDGHGTQARRTAADSSTVTRARVSGGPPTGLFHAVFHTDV
ncbi:MAG TPA: hypothetical protein VFW65_08310 [Pseudonocardiaceae bacterium]|nr:hypothetical protein [Pseudonocardiaceae bacterium]